MLERNVPRWNVYVIAVLLLSAFAGCGEGQPLHKTDIDLRNRFQPDLANWTKVKNTFLDSGQEYQIKNSDFSAHLPDGNHFEFRAEALKLITRSDGTVRSLIAKTKVGSYERIQSVARNILEQVPLHMWIEDPSDPDFAGLVEQVDSKPVISGLNILNNWKQLNLMVILESSAVEFPAHIFRLMIADQPSNQSDHLLSFQIEWQPDNAK